MSKGGPWMIDMRLGLEHGGGSMVVFHGTPMWGSKGGPGLGPVVGYGYPQGVALGSSQGMAPPDLGHRAGWYGEGRSLWWSFDGGLCFLDEGCNGRGSGRGPEGGGGCPLGPRLLDVGSVGGGPGWVPDNGGACPHGPRFVDEGCNGRGPGWRPNGGGGCPHGLRFLDEGSFVGALVLGLTAEMDAPTVRTGHGLREESRPRGSDRVVSVASRTGVSDGVRSQRTVSVASRTGGSDRVRSLRPALAPLQALGVDQLG
ncbi:hypothetical protein GQ457_11G001750 [Hibiscus cannabinus]